MSGETTLSALPAAMEPVLSDEVWMFATLPPGDAVPRGVTPLMTYGEAEGLTLILRRDEAEAARLTCIFPCRRITLNIHSSLEAVGFLAALLPPLAAAGIGVNPA
ncbi:ACT domain-containing protein [Caulobacter sp. DWR1-3-2b1]|uniref:ACT domain-containing protein n=1 Tax=Caulobacter sp. DWR1-3-2b1 TaxID=2804670 RepID=UPI003CEBC258